MKYFKLDKDKREIIIDKYKKYNVNVDILNLIIDLKCENDRLNNIINELEKDSIAFKKLNAWIVNRHAPDLFHKMEIIDKLEELKDSDK